MSQEDVKHWLMEGGELGRVLVGYKANLKFLAYTEQAAESRREHTALCRGETVHATLHIWHKCSIGVGRLANLFQ